MKAVSFSDVRKAIPHLSLIPLDEMIDIEYDKEVIQVLYALGIDTSQGYHITYNTHRNLDNKVVTTYSYLGSIRTDDEYKNSPFCNITDRQVMAYMKDPSLGDEISRMLCCTHTSILEGSEEDGVEEIYADNPKFFLKEAYITKVRGDMYNESGNIKTFAEYMATIS